MKQSCCSTLPTSRDRSWPDARDAAVSASSPIAPPPQLVDGMTTVIDLGQPGPPTIGRVFTFVEPATATWTEHWVVQGPPSFFADPTRHTRLEYPRPQPNLPPPGALAALFQGWWHAALTFRYVAPPAVAPPLAVGTFVFDVTCSAAPTPWQGRLFRSTCGRTARASPSSTPTRGTRSSCSRTRWPPAGRRASSWT
jgi:hypothetical protein